jgi:hypothetical protein
MSTVAVFGAEFSRRLMAGCKALGVPPEWVLAVLALESGFNPNAANPSGARGLWQRMPDRTTGALYSRPPPPQQIADAFLFWSQMQRAFRVPRFTSRAAFYCCNLAPARLSGGHYGPDTVLYQGDTAYRQNASLDVDHDGRITLGELEPCLDRAVRGHQARYDAELASARALGVPFVVPSPSDPPGAAEGTAALAAAMLAAGTRMAIDAGLDAPPLPSSIDDEDGTA